MSRDEINKLEWKGVCRCGRAITLRRDAAYAVLVNKLQPGPCHICSWEQSDKEMLLVIESDANLPGLAEYIEGLRRKATGG